MKAVIQCGGKGTRLRPYTMILPKPLMPVKSEPVLVLLVKWLIRNDIREVFVTTGYLGHLIKSVLGDGSQWGIRIKYSNEKEPLGTIGPLGPLREYLDDTFVVINGDVLTDLNLGDFVDVHNRNADVVTIASVHRKTRMEFGVLQTEGGRLTGFKEKPILSNMVSMGVYCMEPSVFRYIPCGVPFGFDDLVFSLLKRGVQVGAYLHEGVWLDIGRIDDFNSAQDMCWEIDAPAYDRVVPA